MANSMGANRSIILDLMVNGTEVETKSERRTEIGTKKAYLAVSKRQRRLVGLHLHAGAVKRRVGLKAASHGLK